LTEMLKTEIREIFEEKPPVISDDIKEAPADVTMLKSGYEIEKDAYMEASRKILKKKFL